MKVEIELMDPPFIFAAVESHIKRDLTKEEKVIAFVAAKTIVEDIMHKLPTYIKEGVEKAFKEMGR